METKGWVVFPSLEGGVPAQKASSPFHSLPSARAGPDTHLL